MSIGNITTQSLIASLGYYDPTQDTTDTSSTDPLLAQTTDTSSTSTDPLLADQSSTSAASLGDGGSATDISQVGYILSSLSKLQQDPASFKQAAAGIAQDFRTAASGCSDMLQSFSLQTMAAQFSNASMTGSMSGINLAGTANTMVKAYANQSTLGLLDYMNGSQGTDLASQMTSIMNDNLSSILGS